MKKHLPRLNNRGSTMILVILTMMFIAILGSMVMASSVLNIQMKKIDQNAKANFYTAESALDEIRTGLEEMAASQMESAYTDYLEYYMVRTPMERKQKFTDLFMQGMQKALNRNENETAYENNLLKKYKTDVLNGFVTRSGVILNNGREDAVLKTEYDTQDGTVRSLIMKDLSVRYEDKKGYVTVLSTDIRIHMPDINFTDKSEPAKEDYLQYAMIAGQNIEVKQISAADNIMAEVTGSLYAGASKDGMYRGIITARNNGSASGTVKFTVKDADIVTKGDLILNNGSSFHGRNTHIWSNSICTTLSDRQLEPSSDTHLLIEDPLSRTCLAGDLILNAQNSKVKMEGEFYGYNNGMTESIPVAGKSRKEHITDGSISSPQNSAVLINETGCSLDLSGLSKLLIAGRAYISSSAAKTGGQDIPTGESISVKNLQSAYLIPASYIFCRQNPVVIPLDDAGFISQAESKKAVAFKEEDMVGNLSLLSLLDAQMPFQAIYVQGAGDTVLLYYYYRFADEDAAEKYIKEYYREQNEKKDKKNMGKLDYKVMEYIDMNGKGIRINPSSVLFGCGLTYQIASSKEQGNIGILSSSFQASAVEDQAQPISKVILDFRRRYENIMQTLNENPKQPPYDKDSVFKSLVHTDHLNLMPEKVKVLTGENGYKVYLSRQPVFTVNNEVKKGIIITLGDVQVESDFEGLILAGGSIFVNHSVKAAANADGITQNIFGKTLASSGTAEKLSDFLRKYKESDYSYVPDAAGETSQITISDLIRYENWKKSE